MKKVKLLKDHLQHKAGETIEATPEMANYWKRCGVAEDVSAQPEVQPEKKKTPRKK